MPSSGTARRTSATTRGGNMGKRGSSAPRARWSASAMRTRSKYVKSQCGCGVTCSLMRQTAFAMSPITSICGKYTGSTSADRKFRWMTVGFGPCITNGGFSMTSWPTFTMQSHASIALCDEVAGRERGRAEPERMRLVDDALAHLRAEERQAHAIDERRGACAT